MHPRNLTLWLLLIFVAVVTRLSIGLYYLYLGCPRIIGECYASGADMADLPMGLSSTVFIISSIAIIFIITRRIATYVFHLVKRLYCTRL